MWPSPEYKEFIADLLSAFGPVNIRNMFGGAGIYHEEVMFALIAYDALYLKADVGNIPDFEAEGMGPFVYEKKNGTRGKMSYYQVPERLYDDAGELAQWATKAYEVAVRNKK
jgi:DNA transformation protein